MKLSTLELSGTRVGKPSRWLSQALQPLLRVSAALRSTARRPRAIAAELPACPLSSLPHGQDLRTAYLIDTLRSRPLLGVLL